MNLRLTKFKVIASIVIPLLFWIILFFLSKVVLGSYNGGTIIPNFLVKFFVLHNFSSLFSLGNIFLFLVEILVVYLVISIFHKKLY
jgi:hypothetical protein